PWPLPSGGCPNTHRLHSSTATDVSATPILRESCLTRDSMDLLQRVGDHRFGGRALQEPAAARGNDHVLPAVAAHVGRGNPVRRRFHLVAPQFPAVARVEGAEFTVDGGADEDEISGRRDRAAKT